jgi:hypothetical protein
MWKKFSLIALVAFGVAFASAPRSKAGTEMVTDNSVQERTYTYARPRVYYAPPAVGFVVYPAYGYYYGPRFAYRGFHRGFRGHGHWGGHHHWR